ncbi:hypothetical protein B0H21DRAFT_760264 [Amylocystis lapponica]|nr:hypothetical protein B0H21DRAFT_760264 [Amylocystis lapponica]
MSDAYTFSTVDGKTYSRQLFGLEAVACAFAEEDVFFYSGLCTVQLPTPLSLDQLLPAVRASWIRLRHLSPTVAVTTSRLPDKSWVYHYTVPESQNAVDSWAQDTVYGHEDELTIAERQTALAPRIWRPSSGHYSLELHIGPVNKAEGRWVFAIHGPHANADGRSAALLLEQLLLYLREDLSSATPAPEWGTEWKRLTATAVVLTGEFDNYMAAAAASPPAAPPAPPAGFIPFLPPPVYDPIVKGTSASRLLVFDQAKTQKIRELCKRRGRTVTQLIDSVVAVAHVETLLREAKASGEERYNTVVGLYEIATNWLIPLTFKDQRCSLPGHNTLQSPNGTTLFAADGYSLLLDMDRIRKAVAFDKVTGAFARDAGTAFWDGVVANYLDAWGQQKYDLTSFITRWAGFHAGLDTFSAQQMYVSAVATSSIGDVEGLGVMRDLKPAPGKLAAHEIMHSVDGNMPVMIAMYWQYDGKFNMHFHSGRSFHSDREMDNLVGTFESWIDALIA